MSKRPRTMVQLLSDQDQGLTRLITQAKLLAQTKAIINQVVDYQIAQQLEVAKIQNGTLTLLCQSSVWATRLRYMEPQIVEKLNQFSQTKNIQKLQIKVRPHSSPSSAAKEHTKPKRRVSLSEDAAQKILKESEAISDPTLQDALRKLARHSKD